MTPSLTEIIIEKIRKNGPLSFHDFMEEALYYPDLGYYASSTEKIGKSGDYYTAPTCNSLFAEMIGKQLEEMWTLMGKESFTLVEYGAGTGALCRDILHYLKDHSDFYDKLNYCIVEKSAAMRGREKELLPEKVTWTNTLTDITIENGCILSNEVLDNFPVHRVVMENELMEVFVDYADGFCEVLHPAPLILKDYFDELKVELPKGFHTEINLEALQWIKEIDHSLQKGFVLTIDYGFLSSELYREHRRLGTLLCYYHHRVHDCPYLHIGFEDITAHVNFSALIHWGGKYGLHYCGLADQAQFLRSLGIVGHLRQMEQNGNKLPDLTQLHALLLSMGTRLKVLIQQKGMPPQHLTGLLLATESRHLHEIM